MSIDNSYELVRKEVEVENDIESQNLQRQRLVLENKYQDKLATEQSFYTKERDLANNIDNQIDRITKIKAIDSDYINRTDRLREEYEEELKALEEKFEETDKYPYYFRWIYLGPVNKYNGLMNGLDYYVKVEESGMIRVFSDVKFSRFLCKIGYIPEEWTSHKSILIR